MEERTNRRSRKRVCACVVREVWIYDQLTHRPPYTYEQNEYMGNSWARGNGDSGSSDVGAYPG